MNLEPSAVIKILTLAVILESVVQTLKPIWLPAERTAVYFVNLGVGIVLAVGVNYLAGLDLFALVGIPLEKAPIVGVLLTGVLLSRGANLFHDLLKAIQSIKNYLAALTEG